MHGRVVYLINLDGNNLFQLLDLLLNLYSLRSLIAETLDEVLHLSHFLLLILVGSDLLFTTFLSQNNVFVVFYLIVDNLSARDFQRSIRHIINKGPVMTHKDNST